METLSKANCFLTSPAPVTALGAIEQAFFSQAMPIPSDEDLPLAVTSLKKRKHVLVNGPSRKRCRASAPKSVRFANDNSVIPRSVCQEDLPMAWYNRADYKSFREDSSSLVLAFELGILDRIHPDDFCLRGLEASLSSAHLEARIIARGTMLEMVLSTQEAQRGHRITDPGMIRGLSLMLSKDAAEDALKLAAYDRVEADIVMDEDSNEHKNEQ
jgi:hypothetical protein